MATVSQDAQRGPAPRTGALAGSWHSNKNDLDRFHLASDTIDRIPRLQHLAARARQFLRDRLVDHKQYITRYGEDMPEIRNWKWPY